MHREFGPLKDGFLRLVEEFGDLPHDSAIVVGIHQDAFDVGGAERLERLDLTPVGQDGVKRQIVAEPAVQPHCRRHPRAGFQDGLGPQLDFLRVARVVPVDDAVHVDGHRFEPHPLRPRGRRLRVDAKRMRAEAGQEPLRRGGNVDLADYTANREATLAVGGVEVVRRDEVLTAPENLHALSQRYPAIGNGLGGAFQR